MKPRHRLQSIVLTGTLVGLSACFSYVPAELDMIPDGNPVRVLVSRAGLSELTELDDGAASQPFLRGTIVRRDSNGLFLRVPIGTRQEGFHSSELGQDIHIATREIIMVERRELNPVGTGLLVAGTVATGAGVILLILDASQGSRRGPSDGGGPELRAPRIPLISIPVG